MLPLKTIFYLALFFPAILGTIVYHPVIGILAYLFTYNINPLGHWWAHYLPSWAVRYSLILATTTALGILIQSSKVRFSRFLESQEILLLLFLALIWISIPLGYGTEFSGSNVVKMTKVVIILMMATHLITDLRRYEFMLWVLIFAALYLGIEAYSAPEWFFTTGRLDTGVGGSDFAEGNFLAAHFTMVLPFIGIMFLKGNWKTKSICVPSGVFALNGIILCRSRGIFLALVVALGAAVVLAPRLAKKKIYLGVILALLGTYILIDPGFWTRMEQIEFDTAQMDKASLTRVDIWKAALDMASDHPLGIGEGNFKSVIGQYNPELAWRDTHNTLLRCLTEVGIQGLIVLCMLIANAFLMLRSVSNQIDHTQKREDYLWHLYGVKVAMISFLVAGLFITHTYVEEFYWLLMFPVFLKRSLENETIEEVSV